MEFEIGLKNLKTLYYETLAEKDRIIQGLDQQLVESNAKLQECYRHVADLQSGQVQSEDERKYLESQLKKLTVFKSAILSALDDSGAAELQKSVYKRQFSGSLPSRNPQRFVGNPDEALSSGNKERTPFDPRKFQMVHRPNSSFTRAMDQLHTTANSDTFTSYRPDDSTGFANYAAAPGFSQAASKPYRSMPSARATSPTAYAVPKYGVEDVKFREIRKIVQNFFPKDLPQQYYPDTERVVAQANDRFPGDYSRILAQELAGVGLNGVPYDLNLNLDANDSAPDASNYSQSLGAYYEDSSAEHQPNVSLQNNGVQTQSASLKLGESISGIQSVTEPVMHLTARSGAASPSKQPPSQASGQRTLSGVSYQQFKSHIKASPKQQVEKGAPKHASESLHSVKATNVPKDTFTGKLSSPKQPASAESPRQSPTSPFSTRKLSPAPPAPPRRQQLPTPYPFPDTDRAVSPDPDATVFVQHKSVEREPRKGKAASPPANLNRVRSEPKNSPLDRTQPTESIDGRSFFKKARNALSYDEFTALLYNVKSYNVREQSRSTTLNNLQEILLPKHANLYEEFEEMVKL